MPKPKKLKDVSTDSLKAQKKAMKKRRKSINKELKRRKK